MKKGFTLIELLAVIVVLAILALVVTPIVLNIVENAQTGADERSLEGYAKVMATTYYEEKMENTGLTFASFASSDAVSNMQYSGSRVNCTTIKLASQSEQIELYGCKVAGRGYYKFVNGKAEKEKEIEIYTITSNLTNITTSSTITSIEYGNSYSATLSATTGYQIDVVKVTMGGKDITTSAYSSGKINIGSVTGNIVITATASLATYEITNTLTNVSNSNTQATIKYGESYSAELNIPEGYTLDSVIVKMGEEDITETAHNSGVITINNITGDISIVASSFRSFSDDSWSTIVSTVQNGNLNAYKVGATKTIDLGEELGAHTIRVANTTTPEECNTAGFSQTACGFVIEFADIITIHAMNSTSMNSGGWPASEMYTYVNTDIYNALPPELKAEGVIKDTTVVSGYGGSDSSNFTSTDKLYLLSTAEVWQGGSSYDTARELTRQLDYYANLGVTTNNYSGAIKQYNGNNYNCWLRSAYSNYPDYFYYVPWYGNQYYTYAHSTYGVAPAFRIG